MDSIDFQTVQSEFAHDGALRDIYVLNTTILDWQRVLDAIRHGSYRYTYRHDKVERRLPVLAIDAFPDEGLCDRKLFVYFENIQANCHFFSQDEIEFDIDQTEVKCQADLDALLAFMRLLAESSGKDAILTMENIKTIVILRSHPGDNNVNYTPFGGFHVCE